MTKLLSVTGLSKSFEDVVALTDVSFYVERGECLAIVGESGSGKSTLANLVLGLYVPSAGSVSFNGERLPVRRQVHHRRLMQLVQQNPLSALNPARNIGASLRLALDVHNIGEREARDARVGTLLAEVGLDIDFARRRPATLSGGERQRVAIARALACESPLVILDEPTSSLDVLVQARVLRLLLDLRAKRDLTYIFITHDLGVVRNIADRVAVVERGRLVELGAVRQIFAAPQMSYTRRLLAAVPVVTKEDQALRETFVDG